MCDGWTQVTFPAVEVCAGSTQVAFPAVEMRDGWTQVALPAVEMRDGWTQGSLAAGRSGIGGGRSVRMPVERGSLSLALRHSVAAEPTTSTRQPSLGASDRSSKRHDKEPAGSVQNVNQPQLRGPCTLGACRSTLGACRSATRGNLRRSPTSIPRHASCCFHGLFIEVQRHSDSGKGVFP
jgi:hypothetical protein